MRIFTYAEHGFSPFVDTEFCFQGSAVILRVFARSFPFLLFGNLSIISIISVFAHLNHIVEPSDARLFFFFCGYTYTHTQTHTIIIA